ncbi:bifunctional diaminohydroxyphosphoribosylaminopyrimidine deaminase/5-amino-6-(5-phosphoribosylamino)uracil reductase RibD [Wenzhouxiangella sp. C33]|uniref:Riboflavin biosynthesis protein RibD n=2 Tax=Wenzhouxiangella limi TaxID=2707351 RepID=A0A845V299_9GAMM|nr:bifunctional diaminohydroxyphosphoribosylaminopyrimidine deaminase/5-amino-6-(5-phosphoribosylamino)uracil reductase RibD [Wenzhouxiangella limi]NDY96390.1 bifunctional diaminohydroxyphosphoribosylaminopyrimidine deaminase/5-amino-6-(5-phosphoribosylamino)uracil reductase RibD [Wenzhouxiangella limi]
MAQALHLARSGLWTTDPNPRVGCVLSVGRTVVGRGGHRAAGEPHAEVLALREAGARARGATAYVTLEPCSHTGRTPPCADALIEAGVAEVVIAMTDPDPRVSGRGLERLRASGIQVRAGLMAEEARELNIGFVSRHERGRPWLRVKLAVSLDGLTAGPDGRSQWITGPAARADGQRWRARASAIMTGIGTVLADDPRLDVRLDGVERQPLRIIVDSQGRLPQQARLLDCGGAVRVASAGPAPWQRESVVWRQLPADANARIDFDALMAWLAEMELNEVHVEAGPTLAGALMAAGLVDELLVYQAPVLIGRGSPMMALPGMENFDQRLHLELIEQRCLGVDQRLRLRPSTRADVHRG